MLKPLLLSCSAALLAALLIPSAASADDAPPGATVIIVVPAAAPPPAPAPPLPAPAPPPASAPAPDPCASPGDRSGGWTGDPCGGGARARWGKWRPSLAVGLSSGHVRMEDETEGKQRSLIARVAGRRGWAVELELSKLTIGEDEGRFAGGSLIRAFGRRKLAPYVLAAAGGGKLERADGTEERLRYAEIGGGLMLRGRRLSIGLDFRGGARGQATCGEDERDMEVIAGRRARASDDDRERYTRGRIVALVHF